MKKLIVRTDLLKTHVSSYTRKDGTFVQEHDDKRQAAAPADPYGHPNVVGKPSKMVNYRWTKETGLKEVPHTGKPTDAQEIHFLGKKYSRSSRTGTSMHDGTPVRRYHEDDGTDEGGHRVWLDDQGRVHADGSSEVKGLRAKYEAHAKKAAEARTASIKVKGALYDEDDAALGPHKVGDSVSYKGERGMRSGTVKGARGGKVVVEHKAGHTELKHHSELFPSAPMKKSPLKAHVKGYTRKDGTFVKEHDDKRQAASPKPDILQDEKQKERLRDAAVRWGNKEHGQYGTAWMRENVPAFLKEHYNIPHEHAHAAAKEWFPTEEEQLAEIKAKKAAAPKFQEGDTVKVTGKVKGEGKKGVIHETAPSGHFHIVKHEDGSLSSYHESDLSHHDPDDDEDDEDDDDDRDR